MTTLSAQSRFLQVMHHARNYTPLSPLGLAPNPSYGQSLCRLRPRQIRNFHLALPSPVEAVLDQRIYGVNELQTSLITVVHSEKVSTCAPVGGSQLAAPVCAASDLSQLVEMVKQKNSETPVVVYSKTWCPYCGQVKSLFKKMGVEFKAIELDQLVEGQDVQDALYELTGQTTVPSVFIGGKHIGGCDDTVELKLKGELIPLLAKAGVDVESP